MSTDSGIGIGVTRINIKPAQCTVNIIPGLWFGRVSTAAEYSARTFLMEVLMVNTDVFQRFFHIGSRYIDLIRAVVADYVHNLPAQERQAVYFQQDGAAPHRTNAVMAELRSIFGDKVIGHRTTIAWPPRSPDLTPLDFFFWGYLKNAVYKEQVTSLSDLKARITRVCREMDKAIIERAVRSIVKRAEACLLVDGGHIEADRCWK